MKIWKELDLIGKTVLTKLQLDVVAKDIAQFERRLEVLKGRSESTKPESLQKESIRKNLIQKLSQDIAKTQALVDKFLGKETNRLEDINQNSVQINKNTEVLEDMPESTKPEN